MSEMVKITARALVKSSCAAAAAPVDYILGRDLRTI